VKKTKQSGFTLVEIAIVLVIIGLLLGGILKGQEMIVQAKIKNAMADFSGISAAYAGYQDRYRAIPGDDLNATTRWTCAPACNGNGDGVVSGLYNSATATDESRLWWDNLRRAGFVAGNGSQQPTNAFTGMLGVQTGDGASPPTAVLGGISSLMICSANIPDKVAIAIDTSMDDGIISTGTVRGGLQSTPNPAVTAVVSSPFAETGTNIYLLCRQM
jgi:prepilin-type N-terminal cleavage/methylation domain-containing protein